MNLNLLLEISDFKWQNISVDYGLCIDTYGEMLDTLISEEDVVWQHPDIYLLSYPWGSVYEFFCNQEYGTLKVSTGGWLKQRHIATLKGLYKLCRDQTVPLCSSINDLNNHPKFETNLNGILSCQNLSRFHVTSDTKRSELIVFYCSANNNYIDWSR